MCLLLFGISPFLLISLVVKQGRRISIVYVVVNAAVLSLESEVRIELAYYLLHFGLSSDFSMTKVVSESTPIGSN